MKFEEEDEEEVQCQEVFTAKTEFATPIKMHQHKKSSFVELKAVEPMVEESKSKHPMKIGIGALEVDEQQFE